MAGMEIFNTDDLSDDFLEINDDQLLGGYPDKTDDDLRDEDKNKKTVEKDIDTDDVDDDEDKLDLIIPPSDMGDDDNNSDSSTNNPKFFSSLVQALKEGGVLEDITDDDIKSQADFFKVIDESIKQRELADLNDTQKEYLEALRSGIPHEDIVEHQQTIDNYNSITDEAIESEEDGGEDLRKNIIMANFLAKGITEAKARKLTDTIVNSGDDVTEAKEALAELKTLEKNQFDAEKQRRLDFKKTQEKSEQEARSTLEKLVKDTTEIIPGLTIPVNIKNQVVKSLTTPVAYTEDKRPLDVISKYLHDNPIEGRFKLAYLLTVTDNFKKMNVLENKRAKKDVFKDLEAAIKFKDSGGSLDNEDPQFKSKFDLDSWDFA